MGSDRPNTDDASRRDVLQTLAALGVTPGVSISDLDREEPQLPDAPGGDAIWLALSIAVKMDDCFDFIASLAPPTGIIYEETASDLSHEDIRELVWTGVCDGYSEREKEYIHNRAPDLPYLDTSAAE